MNNSQFFPIVKKKNIEIQIPRDAYFSFGTSPYYAHQHGVALDIYHDLSLRNFAALSPVEGKIIATKSLKAPSPRFKGGISREYVTLIKNPKDPNLLYKILHVKPEKEVGETVSIGEKLGTTIKNGYFAPWSSPHIHLEIRTNENPFRARGGEQIPLHILKKPIKLLKTQKEHQKTEDIQIKIQELHPNYYLGTFPHYYYCKYDNIIGIAGDLMQNHCILDGGIPIYKNGIVLHNKTFNMRHLGQYVHFGPYQIGSIYDGYDNFYFYRFRKYKMYLGNIKLRTISLFLGFNIPLIKFIPSNPNEVLQIDSIQSLKFESTNF